jgi:hypothetical protein
VRRGVGKGVWGLEGEMAQIMYAHMNKCIKNGTHNIFNETAEENFPNLEKELSIQIQQYPKTLNRSGQNRTSSCHIIINKRLLKAILHNH